jgi:hypothetical protein
VHINVMLHRADLEAAGVSGKKTLDKLEALMATGRLPQNAVQASRDCASFGAPHCFGLYPACMLIFAWPAVCSCSCQWMACSIQCHLTLSDCHKV